VGSSGESREEREALGSLGRGCGGRERCGGEWGVIRVRGMGWGY
jgi:hypothetical protein